MNKTQFLSSLDQALHRLSKEERRDILHDFEEHFTFGMEEGKTEAEIAASLGSVDKIASELLTAHHVENEAPVTSNSMAKVVWITIGLVLFNVIIVFGPFVGLLGMLVGGWVTSVSFILSPLLVLVNLVIFPASFIMFDVFFAIGLMGLGLLIGVLMYLASRGVINLVTRYVQFNVKLVKGEV